MLTLDEVEASGRDPQTQAAVERAAAQVGPEDVLTLIYTSGTTGPPKGVQLCHRNLLSAVRGIELMCQVRPEESRVISWLPAAHIAERGAHHYLPIVYGLQITSCPDPRQVLSYLPEVRPHWFFAVPRIWEKLKAGLETMIAGQPEEQRERTERALAAAVREGAFGAARRAGAGGARRRGRGGRRCGSSPACARCWASTRCAPSTSAPPPRPLEVLEFFHAIGIPLSELWGMSETCGAGCVNPPERIKLGTVGPPARGWRSRSLRMARCSCAARS